MKDQVEVLTFGPETVDVAGEQVPVLKVITKGERKHHPKCPTYPGEPLASDTICCDCIYGWMAEGVPA